MPIDPSQPTNQQTQTYPAVQPAEVAPKAEEGFGQGSSFGPAYLLGDAQSKSKAQPEAEKQQPKTPQAYTVPLTLPDSPSRTLASLPPLQPLGAASLTELSLQKVLTGPLHGTGSSATG
jgi:hypothetical protein